MLLVTPSRLELLDDENLFIPRLFPRNFGALRRDSALDILVAVVDKIPYPEMSDVLGLEHTIRDSDGFEGISVMVGFKQDIAPDLWAARDLEKTTTQQPGTLSFVFKSHEPTVPLEGDHVSYDLTLPVANTLFHNGQISTLYAERWVTSDDANRVVRFKRALLPQQTLYIDGSLSGIGSYDLLKLSSMLTPIVPPRTIAAAMGNIIRHVYKGLGSNPGATVPASKELEEEIISRKIDSSHGHSIWALVTPRNCEVQEPSVWPSVQKSIKSGSRLHKVLSGGGAWSIKGSLLALDPDCDYNYPDHDMQTSSEDQTKDLARAQFCRDIVNPGDLVSFFACTVIPNQRYVSLKTQENLDSWRVRGPAEVFLGTLPNFTSATIKPSLPFDHLFIGRHFGMLSERGMSIKIHSHASNSLGSYGPEKIRLVTRTKLDAPCTLFSASKSFEASPYRRVEQLRLRNGIVEPSPYTRDESNTKDDESELAIARMGDLAQSLGLQKTMIHKTRSNIFIRFRKFRWEKNFGR